MTEEEKIAFVKRVRIGGLFVTKHERDEYFDVWLRISKHKYAKILNGTDCDVISDPDDDDCYDPYDRNDYWGEVYLRFEQLSRDDSARLLALYHMNEDLFVQACKELKL